MKMTKRALVALLFVVAFSATLFQQGLAASDDADHEQPQARNPWAWRWGRHRPGARPLPPPDPKVSKCFEAFKAAAVCLHPPIGEDCCTALKSIEADCADTRFGHFNHHLLHLVFKYHCDGAKPSPAAPSPAAPSPAA